MLRFSNTKYGSHLPHGVSKILHGTCPEAVRQYDPDLALAREGCQFRVHDAVACFKEIENAARSSLWDKAKNGSDASVGLEFVGYEGVWYPFHCLAQDYGIVLKPWVAFRRDKQDSKEEKAERMLAWKAENKSAGEFIESVIAAAKRSEATLHYKGEDGLGHLTRGNEKLWNKLMLPAHDGHKFQATPSSSSSSSSSSTCYFASKSATGLTLEEQENADLEQALRESLQSSSSTYSHPVTASDTAASSASSASTETLPAEEEPPLLEILLKQIGICDSAKAAELFSARENLLKAIEENLDNTIASAEVIHRDRKTDIATCVHLKNIDGHDGLLLAKFIHIITDKQGHKHSMNSMDGFAKGSSYVNDVFTKIYPYETVDPMGCDGGRILCELIGTEIEKLVDEAIKSKERNKSEVRGKKQRQR